MCVLYFYEALLKKNGIILVSKWHPYKISKPTRVSFWCQNDTPLQIPSRSGYHFDVKMGSLKKILADRAIILASWCPLSKIYKQVWVSFWCQNATSQKITSRPGYHFDFKLGPLQKITSRSWYHFSVKMTPLQKFLGHQDIIWYQNDILIDIMKFEGSVRAVLIRRTAIACNQY